MADASPNEVRIRFIVDSDTPELLKRLAGSKRQSHEIVYRLRLGLQMEMMLNGKVPMVGIASEGSAPVSNQPRASTPSGIGFRDEYPN